MKDEVSCDKIPLSAFPPKADPPPAETIFRGSSPAVAGGRAAKMYVKMYTVYSIYNKKHNKTYIGQTGNLFERIRLHNDGTFSKSDTARFDDEWRLIYREKAFDRRAALLREKQLKSHQGREFLKQFIPR